MIILLAQLRYRIKDLTRILLGRGETGDLRSRFVRGATGTFGLNVAFNGLLFAISLMLARLLGVAGYGVYAYALAWIMVLSIPAELGLSGLLVRNVAAFKTQSAWDHMAGIFKWANRTILLSSFGIALLTASVLLVLRTRLDTSILFAMWIALILLPLTALIRIRRATMQGLYHLVPGQLPEMIFHPILFIAFIGAAYLLFGVGITASFALGLNILATAISLIIMVLFLREYFPQDARNAHPKYEKRKWLGSAVSMMLVSGMYIINSRTDILMLGAISGAEAAGIYNTACRGSELIFFILMPIHQALSPTVSAFYTEKNFDQLQHIVTKSTRIIVLLSLPIVAGLVFFGYWFLLLFGQAFTEGRLALSILSIGQFINIAFGPVALLLIMTNYERDAAVGIGIGAALNVVLNALLIPVWGLEGAAIATVSSKIVMSVLMVIWVYKRLKIHSSVLGKISFRGAM